jgi:hypothetical protein
MIQHVAQTTSEKVNFGQCVFDEHAPMAHEFNKAWNSLVLRHYEGERWVRFRPDPDISRFALSPLARLADFERRQLSGFLPQQAPLLDFMRQSYFFC